MFRLIPLVVALAACAINSPASAESGNDNEVILTPSSPWHVDYADQKCTLARQFGVGGAKHILQFTQGGPSPSFGLVVGGPSFKRFRPTRTIYHRFGDGSQKDTKPLFGEYATFGSALVYSSTWLEDVETTIIRSQSQLRGLKENSSDSTFAQLPGIDLELARHINFLSFEQTEYKVRLDTGNMSEPFAALNECVEHLVSSWGVDIEKHRKYSQAVRWTNELAIAKRLMRDYPLPALRAGESGVFAIRVLVDELGKMLQCHVENMTITQSLETPACKAMTRAKFEPALDINGVPMKSFLTTTITYRAAR